MPNWTSLKGKYKQRLAEQKYRKTFRGRFLRKLSDIRNKYKITAIDYYYMHVKQDFKCLGCSRYLETGPEKHVDHNHVTGKVRGLLCRQCNAVIGYAEEDTKRLINLANYLARR